MKAPVVENVGNVPHLIGAEPLGDPEGQVPVLRTLEALAVAADGGHEVASERAKVREVVLTQQEKGIPVRLEIGL